MASNSYTSANITPSSDTFREWVDLTNRITYDMEKYVVTTAPAGNTQGAETIGNAHVNGYFGANTVIIFDGIAGATGNTTHYGTRAPAANLTIHTNTVFIDDGSNSAIINAEANVYVVNAGIQFTSNSTVSHVTINTTADVFESNAVVNKFNSNTDINANVDIDNALTDITSTNLAITGTETNIDSNTVFTANINITADSEDLNIGSDQVIINSSASLLQSNATLNDFNSNVAIDAANVYINGTNTHINGAELNVDANTVFTANINITDAAEDLHIGADQVIVNSSASLLQSNATLNDINSNVDVDAALVTITAANTYVENGEFNIDSNVVVSSTATNANIAANVDITGANLNTSSNVAITGSNVYITAANVNMTSTGVTIGDANSDLLTVNSNTVLTDKLNVQEDADFDSDINVDGSAQVDGSLTVGNSTANAHISTEGNIDTDGTLTVAGASDLNSTLDVAGATTLESTLQVQSTSEFQDDIYVGNSTVNVAIDAQTGNIDTDGTLTVAGATDLNSTLDVSGASTLESTLQVQGTSEFQDDIFVGNSTVNASIDAQTGDIATDGTLDVTDSARFRSFANVDGILRAKADAHVTGTANVSVRLNVGADVHANTTAVAVGDGSDTEVVIKTDSIEIGNSTVNTSLSTTAVFTDGTLQAEGATDLNSTLAVSGAATFEDTTNSTSNTTGSIIVSGGAGIAKSATVGEDLTVHGDADIKGGVILGDATSDRVEVKGRVNTHIVPDASATRALGTSSLKWDLHADDSTTRILTVSEDATVDGNLDVGGFGNVGYPFTVSNTTTKAIEAVISGTNRVVRIGNTVPTATAADDRLIVRSAVGNSTIGLLPLHGNNVPLGDANHRWVFSAKTGDFSGAVNITATTQASSNSTGSLKVAGGLSARKKAFLGSDLVVEGTANVSGDLNVTTDLDVTGDGRVDGTFTVGGDSANTRVFANGSIDTDGQINVASHANIATLGVTGAADFDSTVTVEGAASLKGDVDLGDATGDTISVNGRIDTSVEPTANGGNLGHDDRRWDLAAAAINSSGNADVGGNLDVTGTSQFDGKVTVGNTTVNAQHFANGSSIFDGAVNALTVFATTSLDTEGTLQVDGQSTFNANVSLNTDTDDDQIHIGNSTANVVLTANGDITAKNITITDSATLPSDTTLTASSLGATDLTVTGNTKFTAASDADAFIQFGTTSPNNDLAIDFQNAKVISDFLPDTGARDIGSDTKRWEEGHFDTKLQVGGSSRFIVTSNSTVANVTADNIFARDELVGASSSDRNLKDSVLTIDTALGKIEQIGGYEFTWNSNIQDERIGKRDYGVIAQEVEEILPHAVNINSRGYKTVNYNSLIPLLIEAVKELSGRVEELERDKRREENLDG